MQKNIVKLVTGQPIPDGYVRVLWAAKKYNLTGKTKNDSCIYSLIDNGILRGVNFYKKNTHEKQSLIRYVHEDDLKSYVNSVAVKEPKAANDEFHRLEKKIDYLIRVVDFIAKECGGGIKVNDRNM